MPLWHKSPKLKRVEKKTSSVWKNGAREHGGEWRKTESFATSGQSLAGISGFLCGSVGIGNAEKRRHRTLVGERHHCPRYDMGRRGVETSAACASGFKAAEVFRKIWR